MRRREFITLLGGAAAAWPLAARAQQSAKLPTIGYLGPATLDSQRLAAVVKRLRDLGWIEGRTIAIEYRWSEGRNEHLAETAAEFVRLKIDVIVTSATPPSVAVKQATSAIPIVFAGVADPDGAGVVESLARPGGNATGLSLQQTDGSLFAPRAYPTGRRDCRRVVRDRQSATNWVRLLARAQYACRRQGSRMSDVTASRPRTRHARP